MIDDPKKDPNKQSDPSGRQEGQDLEQRPKNQQDPSKKNPAHDRGDQEGEDNQQGGQRRAS